MSKIIKLCKHCGKTFVSYIKRNREYCSRTCSAQNYSTRLNKTIIYKCRECNIDILGTKSRNRIFCSKACRNKSDAQKYVGEGNPNFGKRRPNMFEHTEKAKRTIKRKVKASWNTKERRQKHNKFLQKYREENGYIPLHSPEARIKSYETLLQSIPTRKYGGWKGIKQGWYVSTTTEQKEYYSSSYELKRMIELDEDENISFWTKKHKFLVEYMVNNILKKYIPDFYIEYKNGKRVVEEIKGYVPEEDIEQYCSKISYATKYFLEMGIDYYVNFKYNTKNEVICG